jgi:hypothetical protein
MRVGLRQYANDRLRYTLPRGPRGQCFRDARCNATRVTRQCLALPRSRYSRRMRIGYERVSTRDPNHEAHDALHAAGCERIFIDHASGKLATRPELGQGAARRRVRRRPAGRHEA